VGLEGRNFFLTEQGSQVSEQAFLGASYLTTESNLSVVIERSPQTVDLATDLGTALRDTVASTDRVVSVVSAFEQPVKERIDGQKNMAIAARGNVAAYTPAWRFDLALRLAASDLLTQGKKRGVVFIGSGQLGQKAFTRYGLTELADYLANNGIKFYAVMVGNGPVDKELTYLCKQTGGPGPLGVSKRGYRSCSKGTSNRTQRNLRSPVPFLAPHRFWACLFARGSGGVPSEPFRSRRYGIFPSIGIIFSTSFVKATEFCGICVRFLRNRSKCGGTFKNCRFLKLLH